MRLRGSVESIQAVVDSAEAVAAAAPAVAGAAEAGGGGAGAWAGGAASFLALFRECFSLILQPMVKNSSPGASPAAAGAAPQATQVQTAGSTNSRWKLVSALLTPSVQFAVRSPTETIAQPDSILLDLEAGSGEAAVRLLYERLVAHSDAVTDGPQFLADVVRRMQLSSVCIADDIALPHARTNAVARTVFAVGRAKNGIPFDALHPSVRLVFLIGTPKDAVSEYLQTVAMLTRKLRNPATRAALHAATEEGEVRALLSGAVAASR
jgi:mannitol/fructose-specific phosphotransferase system IIA component (Ntr-type)